MPTGNLPANGKAMWEEVYNSAKAGGADETSAARQAWGAVKRKYKKSGDKWVTKAEIGDVDKVGWSTPEGEPIEKSAAGFQEKSGSAGTQCGDCGFFLTPGSCQIVKGSIGVTDLCNFFDPSTSFGNLGSMYARSEFDMVVTKASVDPKTGVKRWAAVASDTDIDNYEDRMSLNLYRDFIQHIEQNDALPVMFTSEAWDGGMPYLGVSHYMDLDGAGIAGDTLALYIDGNRLKAKGTFRDSPLGLAAFSAIKRDMGESIPADGRIRISISFYELEHSHGEKFTFTRKSMGDACPMCLSGIGSKIYTKGQLIHLALTRIPVNVRTPIWLEARSMATIKDDALSVLGDPALVEDLEQRSEEYKRKKKLEARSAGEEVAAGAVVIKSEDEGTMTPSAPVPEAKSDSSAAPMVVLAFGGAHTMKDADTYLKQSDKMYEILDSFNMLQGVMENVIMDSEVKDKPAAIKSLIGEFKDRVDDAVKRSLAIRAAHTILGTKEGDSMSETPAPPVTTPAPTPLEAAFVELRSAVEQAAGNKALPVEERYKAVQPTLNAFAAIIKSQVGGEDGHSVDLAAAVSRAVAEQLKPIVDGLAAISARSAAVPAPTVPTPRAMQPIPSVEDVNRGGASKSPLSQMVRRSVGLRD